MLVVAVLATKSVEAQTYKVLYTFTGGDDGGGPSNQLVRIGTNLYGTGSGGATGDGVVFKLTANGKETVVHSFSGQDGSYPTGLLRDTAGNLYGVTQLGGTAACTGIIEYNGCGVVFEITAAGEFSVLHSFAGADGAFPSGKLLAGAKDNFYGATFGGGHNPGCPGQSYQQGCGTIFELVPSGANWDETVLYNFGAGTDGFSPNGSLIFSAGKLLGTTDNGNGLPCAPVCGAVFQLTSGKSVWTETTPHGFTGGSDGAIPDGGLIGDPQGNLYGTTSLGGALGFGTIFKIDALGKKSILYSFKGTDGAYPTASLVRDSSGNLFGTAGYGGSSEVGTVFELDSTNHLTVLHNFSGGATDGALPYGALLLAGNNLYGTTVGGGPQGWGTVFVIGIAASAVQYDVSLFPNIASNGTPRGRVTVNSAGVTTIRLNQAPPSTTYTVQFCAAPGQLYPNCFTVGSVTSNATGAINSTVTFPAGSWAGDFVLVANGIVTYVTSVTEGIPSTYYATLQLDSTVNGNGTWTQLSTPPPQDPLQSGSVTLTAAGLVTTQLTGAKPNTVYSASQCPIYRGSNCYGMSINITTNQNGDATSTAALGTNLAEDIFYVDNNITGYGFIGGFSIP